MFLYATVLYGYHSILCVSQSQGYWEQASSRAVASRAMPAGALKQVSSNKKVRTLASWRLGISPDPCPSAKKPAYCNWRCSTSAESTAECGIGAIFGCLSPYSKLRYPPAAQDYMRWSSSGWQLVTNSNKKIWELPSQPRARNRAWQLATSRCQWLDGAFWAPACHCGEASSDGPGHLLLRCKKAAKKLTATVRCSSESPSRRTSQPARFRVEFQESGNF
ncbi:hypothetical protein K402DRAFT_393335 [Aulographum hederae CBS 113979]|uniref:Uncharacterized protein n=1 Tax=Aulographum hederae CBS 113979 TaxID=1176131 RepID=A0A6G1H0X7_9PEZI|nr:hypothetical protein K402DRAFT_393335 [Aulographum hederae CBS 113979]